MAWEPVTIPFEMFKLPAKLLLPVNDELRVLARPSDLEIFKLPAKELEPVPKIVALPRSLKALATRPLAILSEPAKELLPVNDELRVF